MKKSGCSTATERANSLKRRPEFPLNPSTEASGSSKCGDRMISRRIEKLTKAFQVTECNFRTSILLPSRNLRLNAQSLRAANTENFCLEAHDEELDRVVYDNDCFENLRSLCRRGNKEELQVLSQLERLEGEQLPSNSTCKLNAGDRKTTASLEKLENFPPEDEIELETCYIHNGKELLHTHQRDDSDHCNKEATSSDGMDDKVFSGFSYNSVASKSHKNLLLDFEYDKQDVSCTWSVFLKEAEELVSLNEDDNSSSHASKSEARKFHKGHGGKTKHKFSIRLPSQKDELSCPSMLKYEDAESSEVSQISLGLEAVEHTVTEHSMAVLLEHLQKEHEKPLASNLPARLALAHGGTEHSMADILEGLQEKNDPLGGCHNMLLQNGNMKERRFQHDDRKALASLGNRSLDHEDPLENMDCQTSSEDEDGNQNHLSLLIPDIKQQTMVDLFQQAFNPAVLDEEGGFFPMNESGCINVQLLSRYLDAKLTVCRCKLLGNIKLWLSESPTPLLISEVSFAMAAFSPTLPNLSLVKHSSNYRYSISFTHSPHHFSTNPFPLSSGLTPFHLRRILFDPSQYKKTISAVSCSNEKLATGKTARKAGKQRPFFSEGRDEDEKRLICPGCGVFMQDQNPNLPGFYQKRVSSRSADAESDGLGELGEFDEEDGYEVESESSQDEDSSSFSDFDDDKEEDEDFSDVDDVGTAVNDDVDWDSDWEIEDEEEKWKKESDGFAPVGVGYGNVTEEWLKKQKKKKMSKTEKKQKAREARREELTVTVCARCHSLRNYGQVKNEKVDNLIPDFDFDRLISNRLMKSSGTSSVIVMVVDCVDFDGSFPKRAAKSLFKALENCKSDSKFNKLPKLVLVATKVDLLPSQISPTRLDRWVRRRARAGGAPKLSGAYLVSAHKDLGVRNLLSFIKELAGPRGNVWVIGAQNAGKSTLINAIAKREGVKVSRLTEAAVPGTTLGILRIGGILPAKAKMYDTPGLLHPYLMAMRLNRDEQKMVEIRKQLQPATYRMKAGQAVHVGALLRLDLIQASVETIYVTVWASPNVSLHFGKVENADEIRRKHAGVRLQPPIGADRVSELGEWKKREFKVSGISWEVNSVDIAVAGLGWLSMGLKGDATVALWTYDGIEIVERDPLVLDRAPFLERPGFLLPKAISDAIGHQTRLEKKLKQQKEEESDSLSESPFEPSRQDWSAGRLEFFRMIGAADIISHSLLVHIPNGLVCPNPAGKANDGITTFFGSAAMDVPNPNHRMYMKLQSAVRHETASHTDFMIDQTIRNLADHALAVKLLILARFPVETCIPLKPAATNTSAVHFVIPSIRRSSASLK
ncbi:hypothetical protein ACLOJK_032379 [Asimina triloba]